MAQACPSHHGHPLLQPHLSGVLHEEALVHHRHWQGPHCRLHVSLPPGEDDHITPHHTVPFCITPHPSHLTPPTSPLPPHPSHFTPPTSPLLPHPSHLTPPTSPLPTHPSHLTPPTGVAQVPQRLPQVHSGGVCCFGSSHLPSQVWGHKGSLPADTVSACVAHAMSV